MWSDTPDAVILRRHADLLREASGPLRGPRRRIPLRLSAQPTSVLEAVGAHARPGSVWLDGGHRRSHRIAWDPLLTVAARDGRTLVRARGDETLLEAGGFETLAALAESHGPGPGRLFGYLGYELGAELERLPAPPPRDIDVADLWLGLHDFWLEYGAGEWHLVTAGVDAQDPRLVEARDRLRDLAEGAPPASQPPERIDTGAVRSEPDGEAYAAAVRRTVTRIHAGEIFQTNLCRRFVADLPGDPWRLYQAMRATGDAGYGAWVVTDSGTVLSRSPECFLRLRRGRVESRPIKGTRRRGSTTEEDVALRRELQASAKDRAELAMIVDLVRNDLGRVCVAGTVSVAEHARLLELPGVWHTASRVRGRLRPDRGPVDLLRATFPAGSITGAPKIQAMIVAAREEPHRRGPAMGAVGWIDPQGDLQLSVAIRTAVAAAGRVVYHAGCGIVADSDPEHEQEESLVKARPFLDALSP